MTTISRSALLPYSADQVFELINDVSAYPQFMDGCVGAEVLSESADSMVARLDLSRAGVRQSFTTRNALQRPTEIKLELVDGPFEAFTGRWTLLVLNEQACKVSLFLSFTLNSSVLSAAAKQLFNGAANSLVDAVVKRAKSVYG
ncbi:ribosome-associated toxin RatA of RatAB toxin-antitoxin module [Litorivivens lipolytica]|uniref:Ribosome-associated toxin RatA of RatAB toxin-antitoxin module n=1 Tax=Litorivivens lipolytica TaxID=1524264 RepID=A0A7W4Z6D7_9GAMM|nr:type II toxin-antitoxin system RatA family toxin [Litorivivens lipolytica]MBB3046835.1 ribosome-associated toxin RatA of RatAB toxin-antitoxin module [Litorivivens lipolytica]